MAVNKEYDVDDFMSLAKAVSESNNGNEWDENQLSEKDKELLRDVEQALNRLGEMSDDEVKDIYDRLKVKFYMEPSSNRWIGKYNKDFKQYKKNAKATLKFYKKNYETDGALAKNLKKCKYISTFAGAFAGASILLGPEGDSIPMWFVPIMHYSRNIGELFSGSILDFLQNYYSTLMSTNVGAFLDTPYGEITIGAFAIGLVLYGAGKGITKLDDVKAMRRIMVQAMGEHILGENNNSKDDAKQDDVNQVENDEKDK